MAEEQEDKPSPEGQRESAQETAVGHPVVSSDEGATEVFFSREEPAAEAPAAGEPATPPPAPAPQPAAAPPPQPSGTSPAAADREAAGSHDAFTDKPELFVAGAFVGAFVVAKLLKKLTGGGS